GPRFETRMSGRSMPLRLPIGPLSGWDTAAKPLSGKLGEDPQPVAQHAWHQEVGAIVLLAGAAQLLAERGVAQDLERALRGLLRRVHEKARDAVLDLERNASYVAGDRGTDLPERLGDRESEALAQRLLQDHVGLRLEGVHLDRAHVVEVVEDLDVLV